MERSPTKTEPPEIAHERVELEQVGFAVLSSVCVEVQPGFDGDFHLHLSALPGPGGVVCAAHGGNHADTAAQAPIAFVKRE